MGDRRRRDERSHAARLVRRLSSHRGGPAEAVRPSGASTVSNVVGPVCESGDTFAMAREMDEVRAGDLVIFRTAGAYGAAMSSGYNSRPLTPEVLVSGDSWALVRRRMDLDDCAATALPEWLT
jgi:diaminopimelate decarboxylase